MLKKDFTLVVADKNILLYLYSINQFNLLLLPKIKILVIDLVYYRLLFSSSKKENSLALMLATSSFITIAPTVTGTRIADEMIKKEPKYYTEEQIKKFKKMQKELYPWDKERDDSFYYEKRRIAHTVEEIDKYHSLSDIYAVRDICDKEIFTKTDLSNFLIISEKVNDLAYFHRIYEDYNKPNFIRLKEFLDALIRSQLLFCVHEVYEALEKQGFEISTGFPENTSNVKENFLLTDFRFDMTDKKNMQHTKEEVYELYKEGKITERDAIYLGNFEGFHDLGDYVEERYKKEKKK